MTPLRLKQMVIFVKKNVKKKSNEKWDVNILSQKIIKAVQTNITCKIMNNNHTFYISLSLSYKY